jgi:hypothetical protein
MNVPVGHGAGSSSRGKHIRGNRRPKPAPPAALQARWGRAAWACNHSRLRALGMCGRSFCEGRPGVAVALEVLQAAVSDMVNELFCHEDPSASVLRGWQVPLLRKKLHVSAAAAQ